MLLKSKISNIDMSTDDWKRARLAKFTASKINLLMGEQGIGAQGLTYIRTRVGEELTGVTSDEADLDTNAIRWGFKYEPIAINEFGKLKNLKFLVVQKLICDPRSRFGCTPDALWVRKETKDKKSWDVSTAEMKCFQMAHHIEMAECETAEDVRKADPKVFWQIIMQMDECDALSGYGVFYHPQFRAGGLRVVEFRKVELVKYFTLLKQREASALVKFNEIRDKLMNIKNAA